MAVITVFPALSFHSQNRIKRFIILILDILLANIKSNLGKFYIKRTKYFYKIDENLTHQ